MEILREAPKTSAFVPLVEHQSATPASFYSGPPVLHYYSDRCKVLVLERELVNAPALATFARASRSEAATNGRAVNGDGAHDDEDAQQTVEEVDIWVTSDKLLLFCNTTSTGVSIPYPSIALHAIQSLPQPTPGEQQGLYMQLISFSSESSASEEDPEPESISVTLIPTASAPPAAATEYDPAEDQLEQTPVTALFTALSNCSNLHPDPVETGEEGEADFEGSRLFQAGMIIPGNSAGGLPPAMPGSGGWITAENMHEYVDDDGNWIGPEEEGEGAGDEEALGPGAGIVRPREEEAGADGEDNVVDETKWQRTG